MNGAWPSSKVEQKNCSSSQTFIGYVPALFYSNMFSIVFLQIKAKTKISSTKDDKDTRIGLIVVFTIFFSAFVFYIILLAGTVSTPET